jgi:hypothetical protein
LHLIAVPLLLILSSLTHFENTFFLCIVFTISYLLVRRRRLLATLCLFLPLIPSIGLYLIHFFAPSYFSSDLNVKAESISYERFAYNIGYFWPVVLCTVVFIALFIITRKIYFNKLDSNIKLYLVFIVIWVIISLVIFRTGNFDPGLVYFSYRAAVLFPVPFVAGLVFLIIKIYVDTSKIQRVYILLPSIIIIGILTAANLLYAIDKELPVSNRTFMSDTQYQTLVSLSNLTFATKPIFVFLPSALGLSAGSLSEYPSNWISAIYGDHYSYLGDIRSLLNLTETKFNDVTSRYYSYVYINKMKQDGLWTLSDIRKNPILVIQDYYSKSNLAADPRYREINSGVYLYQGKDLGKDFYRISGLSDYKNSDWYLIKRLVNGTLEQFVETYVEPSNAKPYRFILPAELGSCYDVTVKYMDGSTNLGFKITYGIQNLISVKYLATGKLLSHTFEYCKTEESLNLNVFPQSFTERTPKQLYVSLLDSLEIEKIRPKS